LQIVSTSAGNYIIRNCKNDDLPSVINVNVKTLPENYSNYFYETLLAELPEAFLIAEISCNCVGYIMCTLEYGFSNFKKLGFRKKGHVVSIAVLKDHRNLGIGTTLVSEAIVSMKLKKCDELYLEVRCSNTQAVKLYERLGFVVKHLLKTYYKDGENAYLMAVEFNY